MENEKDRKIETDGDVVLDDKLKTGARTLDKKIEELDRDTNS